MAIPRGTRLGRYEIRSPIGKGGMAEVYLAEDTQLGRHVAIKLLPPETISDEHARKRLVREARAAAALDHPNICSVYEVGEADGRSFIAMQYVEGETLDARIKRKPLVLKESLSIASQIADALAEAHSNRIIHRDIKAANIIINSRGQAKVMDFGLAKLIPQAQMVDSEADTESLLSTPGSILGTLAYMSPEQVRGETLDARTDIFSFGIVLYEMISGRHPFAGESVAATVSATLTQETLPLARYDPHVPVELERIVHKCLEKDREQRYQSSTDLSIDLRNLERDNRSGIVAKEGAAPGLRSMQRRVELVVLVLIVLALAGVWTYWWATKGKAISSIAILPFVNVNADPNTEYLSDGITETLINGLSQLPGLTVMSRNSVFRYKGREMDAQVAARELGVRAVLMGHLVQRGEDLSISVELIDAMDSSHLWGEHYNLKLADILKVQTGIAREISERLRLRLISKDEKRLAKHYTEDPEAYQLYLKGRYFLNEFNEEGFKKGIECFKQAIDMDPKYALAYAGLADAYYVISNTYLPPQEAMPKAKAAAKKALEIDNSLGGAYATLAMVNANYYWDWVTAENGFKQAIALSPSDATAHHYYGLYLVENGRFDEAAQELKQAQRLDPLSPSIAVTAAWPLYYSRQYDQAMERLLTIIRSDPDFPPAHGLLGDVYLQKKMYDAAITEHQKHDSLGRTAITLAELGYAYAVSGRRSEAQTVLEQLKERSKQSLVSPYGMALIYVGLGEKDQAFMWLEKAYEERVEELVLLKVDARLDSLRTDPRFAGLMRRVGFPL